MYAHTIDSDPEQIHLASLVLQELVILRQDGCRFPATNRAKLAIQINPSNHPLKRF